MIINRHSSFLASFPYYRRFCKHFSATEVKSIQFATDCLVYEDRIEYKQREERAFSKSPSLGRSENNCFCQNHAPGSFPIQCSMKQLAHFQ